MEKGLIKSRDAEMLQELIDMSSIRPVGERLRGDELAPQHLAGNRKQRRAARSNARRKKNKFAQS